MDASLSIGHETQVLPTVLQCGEKQREKER